MCIRIEIFKHRSLRTVGCYGCISNAQVLTVNKHCKHVHNMNVAFITVHQDDVIIGLVGS
jgi:hypothetical protein